MADDIKTEKTDEKQKPWLFKKGESGNPHGRPPGSGISITTEIKKKLDEVPEGQKATYLELLINRIFKQAIQDGDQQMIKNIWNYIDGLPRESIKHEGGVEVVVVPGEIINKYAIPSDTEPSSSGQT